ARHLKAAGVPAREYHCFIGTGDARFWFETDRARAAITDRLADIPRVALHGPDDLRRFHVALDPARFGELYVTAEDDHIFFPNDFYQPLANVFMALTQPTMRRRLLDPRHRGLHGRLPHHPSEQGYVILAEPGARVLEPRMAAIDLAPSLLALVGHPIPEHMHGTVSFAMP
ncbi:MAG: hypothetical protein ACYTG1_13205, partial [Planctomycetota bacterium]